MYYRHSADDVVLSSGLRYVDRVMLALLQTVGMRVAMPELQPDAFRSGVPVLVLSIAAMVLMTRKVRGKLAAQWVIIDVITASCYTRYRAFMRCRLVCSAIDRANGFLVG